jgi:gliding motility-associated-like protein
MKRILFLILTVFTGLNSFSQAITVNNTAYTVPQLVTDVLFASGSTSSSCVGTITNISWSTGSDASDGSSFGSTNGIGFFQNANPNFPLTSGVILSTGNALSAPGPNTSIQSNGTWPGDADLFNYIDGLGIDTGLIDYNNATILEFDFTPLTTMMSFDFLFASEEYGTFQCAYSDSFAFFLTDVTTGSAPVNLALVPSTTTPISVVTIRDGAYYTGGGPNCGSTNPTYFGNFNDSSPAVRAAAATNFNGETVLMTATSAVTPSDLYHIKLVIADRNDDLYDSAVFLGGGSFDIGTLDLVGTGTEFGGIYDFTIANNTAICSSKTIVVQAGAIMIPGVTYSWTNGTTPVGTNSNMYTVTQAGTYTVTLTYPGGCQQSDSMIVEYIPSLNLGTPSDLTQCSAPFNLTDNSATILNGLSNPITFHHTLLEAQQLASPISNPSSYNGVDGEVIYAAVEDDATGCITTVQFTLHIDLSLCPTTLIPGTPPNLVQYETTPGLGVSVFDLTPQTAIIYGTNLPSDFTVIYYPTLADATAGINALTGINAFSNTTNPQTIFAVLFETTNPTNFAIVSFQLIVVALPVVSISASATPVCSGGSSTINFTGTPNAIVNYTVDGNPRQITLNSSGTNFDTTPPLSISTVYTIVSATITTAAGTVIQPQSGTAAITVIALPTASISGTTTVCKDSASPNITFTGANGTAPYTFTYSTDGGTTTATTPPSTGNTYLLPVSTVSAGAITYTLISVQASGTPACSQNQSGTATVTVTVLPTATISGMTTVCKDAPSPNITFTGANGTAPYTFTYSTDGGITTITTPPSTGNSYTLPVSTAVPGSFTYTLISVQSSGAPACSQNQSGTATVTVKALPTATISGTTAVCLNSASPQILVTGANGTAPYTFTYSINSVVQPTVQTTVGNNHLITVPTTPQGTYTYALVSVQDGATPACSQAQSGSAVVTVNPPPTISTPTTYVICDDSLDNDGFYCNFDLNIKINEITGGDSTILVDFYETSTSTSPVASTFPYCNIVPGTQEIFVRAYNSATPECYSTTSFYLTVNPIPLPKPVITDYELCDYNNPGDEVEVFNLGTKSTEIANGQLGVTVSYYATLADAQTQTSPLLTPNSYSNTSNPQQIWINIRNNATGCNTTGSFNLIVNPLPAVTTPPTLFECSIGSSTSAEFELTVNEGTVTGGVGGMIVTYYHTLLGADTEDNTDQILNPSIYIGNDNEVVHIRVENSITGCYATTTQLLRVTQGPVAITPLPLHYCDPNNDGFGVFDLDSTIAEITGSPFPIPGVSVTFHETPTDALTGGNPRLSPYYNITINTQIIYVRVFYTLTGCANYVQLQLIIHLTPVATEPDDYELCDTTGAAGFETFDLTSTIPQILGSLNPSTHAVTFYTSQAAAESGTGNISNPTSYINGTINTETIYVRVEITATGCYDIVTLQLIVNPLPNATQPNYPQYSLCDTTGLVGYETFDLASQVTPILLGQPGMNVTFYPSLSEAQSDSNAITVLQYTNAIIYVQTLGIRITNADTGCYVVSTMDIRVEPLPTPIPPTEPYTICDDNQDGVSCGFDLASLLPGLLNGMTTYTITFHETLPDANSGANDIDISVPYCTINPFMQIIYVRAEDNATGCYSILPIELNADPSPVAPVNLDPITVCDQDSNPQNAITGVDLTQRTPDALAQQTLPATDYTVTYYTSQLSAEQGTAPIIPATNYVGTDGQTIWIRVEHNTTQCFNIGSFLLEIDTPLLLTTPTPLSVCDDDAAPNDQHYVFNLTVKDAEINQGTGYTVTYYPSLLDAQNNTGAISAADAVAYINIPPAVQTLGVVVTTTAGCQSITTLDIRVLPIPTPNTNPTPLAPKCDDNSPGDMMEVFDLTVNETYIGNGDPNLTFHYYYTQLDASVPQNEILMPTTALVGTNVWIRVENNRVDYLGNNCYVLVEQPLTVNPLPEIMQPLAPYRACDDNADGIAVFDLTDPSLAEAILAAPQLPADYTISYYLTQANATSGTAPLPSSYTNTTPYAQDIYIRVVNNATGCVNTGVLPLAVEAQALATGPQIFDECDNYTDLYDGVAVVDLTSYAPAILNGQDPAVFLVSYYTSLADAVAGTSALTIAEATAYQTDADVDTIWVKVVNSSNLIVPFCYAITTIDITVERKPNPVISTANDVTTICVDFITNEVVRPLTLDSGIATPGNYTFEWFEDGATTPIPGATGSTYTVNTASPTGATRNYTVSVTSASALACQTTSIAFPVVQSGPAVVAAGSTGYTVTNAFSDSQTITVNIEGYGAPEYQFSLDDGPRQASNVFTNVSMGTHTIHVWDTKGGVAYSCEELIIYEVEIIDYPHYFTPNGDGIHDTWNIVGLDGQHNAKIYIFDRYGKLMKQISSQGIGWDGTYNGHLLPSDDYWFTVDFIEGTTVKQFKAHFSLKR